MSWSDADDGIWSSDDDGAWDQEDDAKGNTINPLLTRGQDTREMSPTVLIAQEGPNGQTVVARAANGPGGPRMLEPFRLPNAAEVASLQTTAQQYNPPPPATPMPSAASSPYPVPAPGMAMAQAQQTPKVQWGKIVLVGGGLVAAIAGGVALWRWKQSLEYDDEE